MKERFYDVWEELYGKNEKIKNSPFTHGSRHGVFGILRFACIPGKIHEDGNRRRNGKYHADTIPYGWNKSFLYIKEQCI